MRSFDLPAAQQYEELNTMLMFAAAALSIYEYSITFSQEVQTVWKRRATALSLALLVTRWILLAGAVGYILFGVRASPEVSTCGMSNVAPHLPGQPFT